MFEYVKSRPSIPLILFLFFLNLWSLSQDQPTLSISARDYADYSRVSIDSSAPLSTTIEKSESFLFVKIRANIPFRIERRSFRSRFIKSVGWMHGKGFYTLTIRTQHPDFSYDSFKTSDPPQLIIDIKPGRRDTERNKDQQKERSALLEREIGSIGASKQEQRCIVIDPGHGGLETGAKGKFGTLEKDLTIAISKKLAEIIKGKLAYNVVLTREKDVDVSLDKRAAIANNNKASLFISIHVNGSYRKGASGPETYFMSLNATDEEARRLAYLENNSEVLEDNIDADNEDEIKMILWDMAQTAYLKQSSELAESVQNELNLLWGTVNRGIKQAPFKVLTGVSCPAVLVEVAFLSNPQEERKLLTEDHQVDVAEAIYRGLMNFLRTNSR